MKPNCGLLELEEKLDTRWQISGSNSQRIACLAQRVARPWCVVHEQICTEKGVLMCSAPWVCSAPQLMRSAPRK